MFYDNCVHKMFTSLPVIYTDTQCESRVYSSCSSGTSRALLFAPNRFFLSVVLKKNYSPLSSTTVFSRDFARVLNKVGNIFPYIVYLFASPPPLILRRLLRAIKTNHHSIFIFLF